MMSLNLVAQFFLVLFLVLNAGCSSDDDGSGTDDPSTNRTVLKQDKDFKVNAVDLGKYARIVMAQEKVDLEFKFAASTINKVEVKPASLGIQCEVKGNEVTLLDVKPCKAAITINEDYENPIYLFVDGKAPKEWNNLPANTIRYTKGTHTVNPTFDQDDVTIFLEEGAVITGFIYANGKQNIRILGYGVIDGRLAQKAIRVEKCKNVEINGPLIMSRTGWCSSFFECDGVKIDNMKILGSDVYSDGIDLVGSSNVEVNDVFIRNEDDCIAIKTNKFGFSGNVENITVKNSVLWGGNLGNCMEIGWELDGAYLRHIRFENMDVIRKESSDHKWYRGIMSIHQCGNSTISDVLYKDIRMESAFEHLIWMELRPAYGEWGSGGGSIDGVRFENLEYTNGEDVPILIQKNSTGSIKNVVFSGLKYKGRTISDTSDPIFDLREADVRFE